MSGSANFKIGNPDHFVMTLTLSMTMKEWRELRDEIADAKLTESPRPTIYDPAQRRLKELGIMLDQMITKSANFAETTYWTTGYATGEQKDG